MGEPGAKILLVDGDKVWMDRLRPALESKDYQVTWATSGAGALKAFEGESDRGLAIIVKNVKDVRSSTLAKDLREMAKENNGFVYIIKVAEEGKSADMLGALTAGVDDFLAEPYDDDTLLARISVGIDLLDGLRHGASRYERHNLIADLLEEHTTLNEIVAILDFVEKRLEKGIPRTVTEWCLSTAFLMDFDVHVAKETVYIDRFQESVARTQAEWFADISRDSFKTLQEQHELLQRLAVELKGEFANYLRIRKELEPLVELMSALEISMQIGDRDDDLEINLAKIWAKIQAYYANRKKLIHGLRKSIKAYLEFIPGHFQLEERLFFPFSSKYLSEDDLGHLANEFKRIEDGVGRDRIKKEKKKVSKMSTMLKDASLRELRETAETL